MIKYYVINRKSVPFNPTLPTPPVAPLSPIIYESKISLNFSILKNHFK